MSSTGVKQGLCKSALLMCFQLPACMAVAIKSTHVGAKKNNAKFNVSGNIVVSPTNGFILVIRTDSDVAI